jgi:hypothetical protein
MEAPKRIRADVSQRRKDNKEKQETCVKSCLRKSLYESKFKLALVAALDARCKSYSRRIHLVSLKISGLLKHLMSSIPDQDLPAFSLPLNLFDATTIRHMMLGTDGARNVNPAVARFILDNQNLFPNIERHTGDSNTYTFGATQYITVLKNHLHMNLDGRIRSFLKRTIVDKAQRSGMLYEINGWTMPATVRQTYFPTEASRVVVNTHRSILGLGDSGKITKTWLKNDQNQIAILKYFVYLNRCYARLGLPEFNISPIFAAKRHFCTIDTSTFYGIMKDVKAVTGSFKTFSDVANDHWHSTFNIKRLQGKHNEFTRTVQTDGIALVTHFRRPKNGRGDSVGEKSGIALKKGDRVVAFDPGRVNILFGVENGGDGVTKTYKLTRKHYYTAAGILDARKHTNVWNSSIAVHLAAMSKVTTKGVSVVKHERYIAVYSNHQDAIWEEYFKPRWARQRLRLYGAKKRVFSKFFNEIESRDAGSRVVVAYGGAKFAAGGKGEVSVPTSRAFKECSLRFPTIVVDEFRTTKVFEEDDSILGRVQLKRFKGKATVLRDLLWSSTKNKFVGRDLNAALNILRCATLPNRPPILDRKMADGKLTQMTEKWIC